jgi:hypothetical protein
MPNPKPVLISNSAGDYEVHLYGTAVGHVGKAGRIWIAKLGEQELGEHRTRREAVEAIMDVYFT